MNILRSLRWRLRTWLNKRYWERPIAEAPRLIKSKIIVGLTTSPQRISQLEPVLRSILRQSCPPDEIHLNIPHIFKRDGRPYVIPPCLGRLDGKIKIHRVEDMGPGTKIIPTLLALDELSDTIVITADDDVLMLPQAIEVLTQAFAEDSSMVYGLSGYNLGPQFTSKHFNQRQQVNILEGYAHFAVHRKFISPDFTAYLNAAHSIQAGYLHDDVVFANYFALKKVKLVQLFDQRANRKILRRRGAQLHYGIRLDALHKGGGDAGTSRTYEHQREQAREIANSLGGKGLWALSP